MAHFLRRGAAALPQVTSQPRLRRLGTAALRASGVPLARTALGRAHGPPLGPQTGNWAVYQGLRGMAVVEQAIDDFGAESITEGTVQEWKKKVGDAVSKGEVIAVVETDKVTVDVNAKESGTIEEILVKADENVLKGQTLVKIAVGAGAAPSAPAPETPAAAPAAPASAPAADGPARVLDIAVQDFGAESITEGTLMEWRKEVGAFVEKGELLAVIETDKVTVDVKADEAGVLSEILVQADGTVSKGQPLAKLTAGGGGGGAAPAATATAPAAPAASGPVRAVDIVVKDFGAESITEGTLMEWRKDVGQFADKGEILAVIETDKVSIEVKAEEAGTLTEILIKADGTVEAGATIAKMSAGGAAPAAAAAPAPTAAAAPAAAPAAPASGAPLTGLRAAFARLAALRLGLPWPPASAAAPVAAAKSPAPKGPVPKAPVSGGAGRIERRVPISPMRQRVVQRIKDTQNTAALLTTFQEADMSAALGIRSKYHEAFQKKHGVDLGLLSLFAKASACALQEVPGVNAVIDDAAKETVYRESANISVPIPTPRGPISCVLPGVRDMSILDIEYAIHDLRSRALKDELAVDDMLGATFGIVDAGVAGGMMGTGMINPPQSAVLGTNAVTNRVVVVNGKVVARPIMYLSLTYDHRLIDGREAVTFLCAVRDKMEDPSRLMLDL